MNRMNALTRILLPCAAQIWCAAAIAQPTDAIIATPKDEMFIEVQVDEHQIYLGQTIPVQYDVYVATSRGRVYYEAIEPEFGNWYATEAETPKPAYENIDARSYNREPFARFFVTPTTTGKLPLPALRVQVPFLPNKPWITHEPPLIEVVPTPTPYPKDFAPGNVGKFTLKADIAKNHLQEGESTILTIQLEAQSPLTNVKLAPYHPDILNHAFEFFDLQYDQAETRITSSGMRATQSYHLRLTARQAGNWTLPPLQLISFDPERHAYQTISSPPIDVIVAPHAQPQTTADAAIDLPVFNDTQPRKIHLVKPATLPSLWWLGLLLPPFCFIACVICLKYKKHIKNQKQRRDFVEKLSNLKQALGSADSAPSQWQTLRSLIALVFDCDAALSRDALCNHLKNRLTAEEYAAVTPIFNDLFTRYHSTHQPVDASAIEHLLTIFSRYEPK